MHRKFSVVLVILTAMLPLTLVPLPHDWRFLPLHFAVLAMVLAVAWRAPFVDDSLEGFPAWRWLMMAATSSAMVWALIGGSPRAQWGIIDDHEIHALIGPHRDRNPAGDLPAPLGGNHEPPSSMARYLRLLQVSNPLFLNPEGDSDGAPRAMLVAEATRAFGP